MSESWRSGAEAVARQAQLLSAEMPLSVLREFAERVRGVDTVRGSLSSVVSTLPSSRYRDRASKFLDVWRQEGAAVSPEAAALAILAAASSAEAAQQDQTIELVWTGPESGVFPVRRTEQALLQVITAARESLLVVSYAVYKIAKVSEELIRASERGVRVQLVIESPEHLSPEETYSTLRQLGSGVTKVCEVYLWPPDQREQDELGKIGKFHAKCAVADDRLLFVSSANLTDQAFSLNAELGVLITGGETGSMVARHFEALIQRGVLRRYDPSM